MCGIAGILSLSEQPRSNIKSMLQTMNALQQHRGPDGFDIWCHLDDTVGLAHRRLAIIDLTSTGDQPMAALGGQLHITYNGEIYNYIELRVELSSIFEFRTQSDTEVILAAYAHWGSDCLQRLRGMFSFAIWDEQKQCLFCARDRFGIKPFYFAQNNSNLYFASETKALLPFLPSVETNLEGLKDYLTFQFCLGGKTLFKGISELLPGHFLVAQHGTIITKRYWEVHYRPDFDHTSQYFEEHLRSLLKDSVKSHLRSDVPIGAYLSGGLDSSAIATLAKDISTDEFIGFTGKFGFSADYDESRYARAVAQHAGFVVHEIDITSDDFISNIRKVIYHLDQPIAGPGSFSQYMVSKLASQYRKVVLGGQGGDEIFGGYTRYLIAYFEQCIKSAIDGTMQNGNFIVTYDSIIPNLNTLRNYKPLLQEFWRDGLFDEMDQRYFRLINRAPDLKDLIKWDLLGDYSPYESFRELFYGKNVEKQSYFDLMTHFDFKTLLPALLQVEDRMSMAHGLESRVPFLDHPLVELAATIPANIKFKDGEMKHIFKKAVTPFLPTIITQRKDKMGFPTPLNEWLRGPAYEFVQDIFSSQKALERPWMDSKKVRNMISKDKKFGRNSWALLSLELWQQEFIDKIY